MCVLDLSSAMAWHRKAGPSAILLTVLLALAGCAGMEPYEPYNYREEGPEKGIFTGSTGEFVIFGYDNAPKAGGAPGNEDEANVTKDPE